MYGVGESQTHNSDMAFPQHSHDQLVAPSHFAGTGTRGLLIANSDPTATDTAPLSRPEVRTSRSLGTAVEVCTGLAGWVAIRFSQPPVVPQDAKVQAPFAHAVETAFARSGCGDL